MSRLMRTSNVLMLLLLLRLQWHDDHPGTDIAPLIGYSTSFYAMQGVDRILHRNTSKNFWLHVAFQAVHGKPHRRSMAREQ